MRINHNIAALRANNLLSRTNGLLDESLERLSSGSRINKAADDAAGMAISEKMRTQIDALDQASRNASDGISVIQTAEGALSEVESMVIRMRELAVQASNGTYTAEDRKSIQSEIDQLNQEVKRISETTEFNTIPLLDGSVDRKSYCTNNKMSLVSLSDTVASGNYEVKVKQDARQAVILGNTFDLGTYTEGTKVIASNEQGKLNINGREVTIETGDTFEQVFNKIVTACDEIGVNAFATNTTAPVANGNPEQAGYTSLSLGEAATDSATRLAFVSQEYGSDEKIEIFCNNDQLCKVLGLSKQSVNAKGVDAKAELVVNGTEASLFSKTATIKAKGNAMTITDRSGFEMVVKAETGMTATTFTDLTITGLDTPVTAASITAGSEKEVQITVLDAGPMDLQIGANAAQSIAVSIPEVSPATLGIDQINIATPEGAEKAVSLLDAAINKVSSIRAKLGAYQNRLEHSISSLDITSENMTESLSRIKDIDMAEEMANYTQKNVLAQAGTAMLAQANQRPQTILSLIQQ